jgi:hypothetical protein
MTDNITRPSSSISSSSSTDHFFPIRIRLFTAQVHLIREMMYKPDKDGRTLRHLSGNEWAKVKRGQNNAWQTQRASTAMDDKRKRKAAKFGVEKKHLPVTLPKIVRAQSSTKIPLPKELRKVDYRVILRSNESLHRDIINDWEKKAQTNMPTVSIQSLIETTKFQRKSWIRQVDMAVQFSTNRTRRLFRETA